MKLIPPVGGVRAEFWKGPGRGAEDGKSGAGGSENEDLLVLSLSSAPLFWIVDVRLASNAATASADRVWENDRGGNGTLPGAGATRDGYGYVADAVDEFELPAPPPKE